MAVQSGEVELVITHLPGCHCDLTTPDPEATLIQLGCVSGYLVNSSALISTVDREGAVTSYEEWRVTGTPGLIPVTYRFRSEEDARACVELAGERLSTLGRWADGPHLHRRTVTVTEWEAIES